MGSRLEGGGLTCVEVQMFGNQKLQSATVIGPLGEALTLEKLPPANTTRWTIRRKAEVVAAIQGGLLSPDEVCWRYSLTIDELVIWLRAVDRSGMPGLRVTRVQQYRKLYERRALTDSIPLWVKADSI